MIPSAGDGVWPASVVEVELVIREFLAAVPEAKQAAGARGPVVGYVGERLFEVTPPTSIPSHLLETERQRGLHGLSPLLAWMSLPGSSSDPNRNVYANHDLAVGRMRLVVSSLPDKVEALGSFRSELEAILLPALTSATVLSLLFDKVDPFTLAVLAPTIYPLYKLFKKVQ